MQAAFIIGEQRSGSNLLRLMLNQLKGVAAPHPPHILQRFGPLMKHYELEKNTAFGNGFTDLVDDLCGLVELNPVPWHIPQPIDRKEVTQRCTGKSLVELYVALMNMEAESSGNQRWICKSLQNVFWAERLIEILENPQFIYLYRDPRDVYLSFTKAIVGEKHPYHVAHRWTELQEECCALGEQLSPQQFTTVSYENLVKHPESTLQNLCRFLSVPFEREALNFHKSGDASATASAGRLWENVRQPVATSSLAKFRSAPDQESLKITEMIAGPMMDRLGYPRHWTKCGATQPSFGEDRLRQFNRVNELLKQQIRIKTPPDDLNRLKPQEEHLESVTQRIKIDSLRPTKSSPSKHPIAGAA